MKFKAVLFALLSVALVFFFGTFQASRCRAASPPSSPATAQAKTAQDTANDLSVDDSLDEDYLEDSASGEPAVSDPFENFNRKIYRFNDSFYFHVAKPVARVWAKVLPREIRVGIGNIITNIRTPIRFTNCLLQGNVLGAAIELDRLLVNSTLGIGGFFDPAGQGMDLPKQPEDTGQTLGVWKMKQGIYIMWPVIGPTTVRRNIGFIGDVFLDPITYVAFSWLAFLEVPVRELNNLSFRLGDYEALKKSALDPYVAIRNGYVQYRRNLVKQRGVVPVSGRREP